MAGETLIKVPMPHERKVKRLCGHITTCKYDEYHTQEEIAEDVQEMKDTKCSSCGGNW